MPRLFLLFTVVPLVDLLLLVRIGEVVGLWPALALVVATGALGAWLAKAEGRRVLRSWQRAVAEGRLPDEGILSGALVLVGGVLLVTPGVLTDAVGLLLLLPPTRRLAAAGTRRWLERQVAAGRVHVVTARRTPAAGDAVVDVTPPRRGAPRDGEDGTPPAEGPREGEAAPPARQT